jgi:hypothetical protein
MILLSIVLLVALYYLYIFLLGSSNGTQIIKIANMTQTPAYDKDNNTNPGSYRYCYAIWVRVNNLGNNTVTTNYGSRNPSNNIMYLTDIKETVANYSAFSLDLYGDTSLYVRYNDGTLPTAGETNVTHLSNPYLVTPNFPLQKWTLIIVSFDNKVMDLYLDGKLAKSTTLTNLPAPQTINATMSFGKGDIDVFNYVRYSYPMDPQTAWSIYKTGTPPSSSIDNYGLNLKIKKDNVPWGKWGKIQLF